jgi:hypothetical protein
MYYYIERTDSWRNKKTDGVLVNPEFQFKILNTINSERTHILPVSKASPTTRYRELCSGWFAFLLTTLFKAFVKSYNQPRHVCLSVSVKHRDSQRRNFGATPHLGFLITSVNMLWFNVKSDKNDWYLTWRRTNIQANGLRTENRPLSVQYEMSLLVVFITETYILGSLWHKGWGRRKSWPYKHNNITLKIITDIVLFLPFLFWLLLRTHLRCRGYCCACSHAVTHTHTHTR